MKLLVNAKVKAINQIDGSAYATVRILADNVTLDVRRHGSSVRDDYYDQDVTIIVLEGLYPRLSHDAVVQRLTLEDVQ